MYVSNPTGVVATSDVQQRLLSATSRGAEMAEVSVSERLAYPRHQMIITTTSQVGIP